MCFQRSISFDSLREISSVLSKFSAALLSYNIEKPKVISCTALREAKNRALVADQLKVRNGVDVTVLEDSQEKAYIYQEIIEKLNGCQLETGNTMIAYVALAALAWPCMTGSGLFIPRTSPWAP